MKIVKMLLWAAFSISSIGVVAQNRSKKELMKIEVMKIQPSIVSFVSMETTSKKGFAALSAKEQMKREVLKMNQTSGNYYIMEPAVSNRCTDCVALSFLSPKEKMKAQAMNLSKCDISPFITIEQTCKCVICETGIISVNSKDQSIK